METCTVALPGVSRETRLVSTPASPLSSLAADSRPGRVACRGDGREDTRTPGEAGVDTAGLAGVVAAPEPAGRLSRWEERLSATSTR